MPPEARPLEERFWEKVDVRGPDECWEWMAGKGVGGYGRVSKPGRRGGTKFAHILSWEIETGREAPPGEVVRHTCDNPGCVNPAHLLLGSYQDNSDDMVERGRQNKYEGHHNAKLTLPTARNIRSEYVKGSEVYGYKALAEKYGVSINAIRRVVAGTAWKE